MQLKSRQVILFVISCSVLYVSQLSGGALLALFVLLQLSLLIQGIPFTKNSQLAMFKIGFVALPICFLWSGAHSLLFLYAKDQNWLAAGMAASVSILTLLLVVFELYHSNSYLEKNQFQVLPTLSEAFNNLKKDKARLFKMTGLVFLFSLLPKMPADWQLVFALTAALGVANRQKLKTALLNF
jgi:hypothetical protein